MKKSFLSVLLVGALTMLAACGSQTPAHVHAEGTWSGDLKEHWKVCGDCGESFEHAAHTLEETICTACGMEALVWEDGSGSLYQYNENGDCIWSVMYATDGSVESEEAFTYEYDAEGRMTLLRGYTNGVLANEYEFGWNDTGERVVLREAYYYEDGTKGLAEYNQNGNVLYNAVYTADGSVDYAYAYEYNEDGTWMKEEEYIGERLAAVRTYTLDADGVQSLLTEVIYEEDGSWVGTEYDLYDNVVIEIHADAQGNVELDRRYEYTYDENGSMTSSKILDNGVLKEEVEYFVGSDEEGHWSLSGKSTVYHEDGSKTVSDRDLDLTWATEITYDPNGNVVTELRYEYEYDEDGDQTVGRSYENGRLYEEMQSIVGPDGETTGLIRTKYEPDGTKTVTEYNTEFDVVQKTVYDPAGNIVSQE